ncbi:MAG: hypothetical protein ABI678_03340 [Kofleriaceae bacterium]
MSESQVGWRTLALEAVVAIATIAIFLALALSVRINPLLRLGQVSGLASLQLRFALIAIPTILAVIALRRSRHFELAVRLACAVLAGLASAFVAGGVIVALRHTDYCLNAHNGDTGLLALWANGFSAHDPTRYPPAFYPPAFPHILGWYKDLSGQPALYALKDVQIVLTALVGPATYLAWRRLLRPMWALAIGVVATLVLVEPYKPYEGLVLVILVPVLIQLAQALRTAEDRTIQQLAKAGLGYGLVLGALFLLYSGWFKWSAPGFIVAALWLIPWRDRRWRAPAILAGVTIVVFVAMVWGYLGDIHSYGKATGTGALPGLGGGKPMIQDDYIYFDVLVDPTYFALWKGDLPGPTTIWPPVGELGGIGVYTLILFAGFGTAIALCRGRTPVIALAAILVGAWLMRFWYAHHVYDTHLVQLYPRTSIELAYGFVLMVGFAVYYAAERVVRERPVAYTIGALAAFAFVFGTAGSAIADRYMPSNESYGLGLLAWQAHDATKQAIPPDPP